MRANLAYVCLALGGLVSCAAAVKTAEPTLHSTPEMAKYTANVGKDYWVRYAFFNLCATPSEIDCPSASGHT